MRITCELVFQATFVLSFFYLSMKNLRCLMPTAMEMLAILCCVRLKRIKTCQPICKHAAVAVGILWISYFYSVKNYATNPITLVILTGYSYLMSEGKIVTVDSYSGCILNWLLMRAVVLIAKSDSHSIARFVFICWLLNVEATNWSFSRSFLNIPQFLWRQLRLANLLKACLLKRGNLKQLFAVFCLELLVSETKVAKQ